LAQHETGPLSIAYSIADQSFWRTKSVGILNLSMQLAQALASRREIQRLELFSNSTLQEWHALFPPDRVHSFDRACASRVGRILWDQRRVYAEARKRRVEWLLLPKGFGSFCCKPHIKVAAYVHDVMNEWYRQRYPQAVSTGESWYFRQGLLATLKRSNVIFTNSAFTRGELIAFSQRHGINPPEVVVGGVGFTVPISPPAGERDRILVLASPLPHKRTDLALKFMAAWQASTRAEARIVCVGRFPPGVRQPQDSKWEYHERLDQGVYQSLVARARVVVYFSEYEGFGMPPVEAVLNGACPVYSAIPATDEVMRGIGAPFQNSSTESFVAAMTKALSMSRSELETAALSLKSRHNWSSVADRITAALLSHSEDSMRR
jgi:hypothetical protein